MGLAMRPIYIPFNPRFMQTANHACFTSVYFFPFLTLPKITPPQATKSRVPFYARLRFAPPSSSIDPPTPAFSHRFFNTQRHMDLVPWPIKAAKNHVQGIS
jgi:hypothetical protein